MNALAPATSAGAPRPVAAPGQVARLAVLGASGYAGREFVRLALAHPGFRVVAVASREHDGQPASAWLPGLDPRAMTLPDTVSPSAAAAAVAAGAVDTVIACLPHGAWRALVLEHPAFARVERVVDLSSDHRDGGGDYRYGLPEAFRTTLSGAARIANPGCYATAMQLALAPLVSLLAGPAHVFGVSGYSGAGTTPSPKNDPERLRENLLPYQLTGHLHEREASHHLGHPVRLLPHVAPFFRGIALTISIQLRAPATAEELFDRVAGAYSGEPLVRVTRELPEVRAIRARHGVAIGGFSVADGGRDAALGATIDNLLKGAATQAVQNLNLAFGFPEDEGLRDHGRRP